MTAENVALPSSLTIELFIKPHFQRNRHVLGAQQFMYSYILDLICYPSNCYLLLLVYKFHVSIFVVDYNFHQTMLPYSQFVFYASNNIKWTLEINPTYDFIKYEKLHAEVQPWHNIMIILFIATICRKSSICTRHFGKQYPEMQIQHANYCEKTSSMYMLNWCSNSRLLLFLTKCIKFNFKVMINYHDFMNVYRNIHPSKEKYPSVVVYIAVIQGSVIIRILAAVLMQIFFS